MPTIVSVVAVVAAVVVVVVVAAPDILRGPAVCLIPLIETFMGSTYPSRHPIHLDIRSTVLWVTERVAL